MNGQDFLDMEYSEQNLKLKFSCFILYEFYINMISKTYILKTQHEIRSKLTSIKVLVANSSTIHTNELIYHV